MKEKRLCITGLMALWITMSSVVVWFWHRREDKRRHERNTYLLSLCSPSFAARSRSLLNALEAAGYKPEVGESWRSKAAQRAAFERGSSTVLYSRHTELDEKRGPASSAIDLLTISQADESEHKYEVRVACLSALYGLETGIEWGLDPTERLAARRMVTDCRYLGGKVGWDPLHVQELRQSRGKPECSGPPCLRAPSGVASGAEAGEPLKQNYYTSPVEETHRKDKGVHRIPIVVFVDFECIYSRQWFHVIDALERSEHNRAIDLVVKQYPLEGHPGARREAEFATCVARFDHRQQWEMMEYLFSAQGQPDVIVSAVKLIKLRSAANKVRECFDKHVTAAEVDADIASGIRYGVVGTPTTFVNGESLNGLISIDELRRMLRNLGED